MENNLSWKVKVREKVRILLLTLGLLGLQFAWSVELAFGTPFLKSVGVSTAVTAMVWLAGPISGLIMQPIVGAYSDAYRSKYGRRRPFMAAGTFLSVFAFFMIGWSPEIPGWFSSEKWTVNTLTQFFAVLGFYLLDFSINAVQAACRALIIDAAGKQNQEVANAWAGRMLGMGGAAGYFVGTLPLKETFGGYLGNTQMQVLCVFGSLSLCLFIGVTCWATPEKPLHRASVREKRNPFHALLSLKSSFRNLPPAAQRLFNVQFFAWIGWMPFLFYSSQWVAESYRRQYPDSLASDIPVDDATGGLDARAGSLAMLLFSLVSLFSSFVMPVIIVPRGKTLQRVTGDRPCWKRLRDAATLPRTYTASHLLFACCMLLTPLGFKSLVVATLLPTVVGLSYAVTTYVPFVILAECVEGNKSIRMTRRFSDSKANLMNEGKEGERCTLVDQNSEPEDSVTMPCNDQDVKLRSASQLTLCTTTEVDPTQETYEVDDKTSEITSVLMETSDSDDADEEGTGFDGTQATKDEDNGVDGGTILGIHNCYVVAPQFLTSALAFVVFLALDNGVDVFEGESGASKSPSDNDSIGWVLRLGGVSALIAAYLSLKIE